MREACGSITGDMQAIVVMMYKVVKKWEWKLNSQLALFYIVVVHNN
jgi:hypothetical protein